MAKIASIDLMATNFIANNHGSTFCLTALAAMSLLYKLGSVACKGWRIESNAASSAAK
jgi:hypothetical protein